MFNKYKYKPCQCGCHAADNLEGNFTITYICECDCKPSKLMIRLKEENEKLKAQNKMLESALADAPIKNTEWENIVLENNKLKAENNKYAEAFAIKDNDRYVFERLKERADYYQAMVSLEQQVKELKADNEELKAENGVLNSGLKSWRDYANEERKACQVLANENQQLKAQLQNRDKASQVERKPHKCPVCKGAGQYAIAKCEKDNMNFSIEDYNCVTCNGTGLVWEK